MERYLSSPVVPLANDRLTISDLNVNSILQRIAPEYVTVRVACIAEDETTPGVDSELLVVDEKDVVVKAFRLDKEQINIVNRISKDDPNQLILACAGSGKSVLLISKCFKAAQMNPTKKFLITCRNENLHSLYTWFIDRAGLREKNVECMTFHTLCKRLLAKNGYSTRYGDFDGWVASAIDKLNQGKIPDRYYGIFIDEVQAFEPEWYKFCFNLLENKSTKDHIFVICGDKTQRLDKLKKRGQAPWQVGEGYPNYRGGNKNIRIEKNYRNCIEINEYINRYVSSAKQYLYSIQEDYQIDPDMFLRGQAVSHGVGVFYSQIPQKRVSCEIDSIIQAVQKIHGVNLIVATSMISHGVDADRFNIMFFYGMPGNTAEYIQAYSRTGRRHSSIVIDIIRPSRETDQSYLKNFVKFHEFKDIMVESVPINRWATKAIDGTLPGIFTGLLLTKYDPELQHVHGTLFFMNNIKKAIVNGNLQAATIISELEMAYGCTIGGQANEIGNQYKAKIESFVADVFEKVVDKNWEGENIFSGFTLMGYHIMNSLRDTDTQLIIELE